MLYINAIYQCYISMLYIYIYSQDQIYQSDLRFFPEQRLPNACIIQLFPTLPLTNAKKATVSVLYWYIKLSELLIQ